MYNKSDATCMPNLSCLPVTDKMSVTGIIYFVFWRKIKKEINTGSVTNVSVYFPVHIQSARVPAVLCSLHLDL